MANVRGSLCFIATLALISGCSLGAVPGVGAGDGGTDSGSGSGSGDAAAEMAFTTTITPIVTAKTCTQAACHGGVQPPFLMSFAMLKSSSDLLGGKYLMKPGSSNIFVTKATMLAGGTTHPLGNAAAVQYLDATEQTTFATFIDMYGQ